jgi:hypothetical protein
MGSSVYEVKAASVSSPVEVYVRTTVAASEVIELPDEFKHNWITLQADGEDVYVAFGTATLTADDGALSALGPPIAPAVNGVAHIPDGTSIRVDLTRLYNTEHASRGTIFLAHISPVGAAGVLRFWRSSGKAPA